MICGGAACGDTTGRVVGSAGSPLPPEGYAWIGEQLGPHVQLNVGSGGTDVCSGLVQNNPLLPVRAGMISGRALAVDADGVVIEVNRAAEELLGTDRDLVVGRPASTVVSWRLLDGSAAPMDRTDLLDGEAMVADLAVGEGTIPVVVTSGTLRGDDGDDAGAVGGIRTTVMWRRHHRSRAGRGRRRLKVDVLNVTLGTVRHAVLEPPSFVPTTTDAT